MSLSSSDVLFVSKGTGVVAWYRCGMPSFNLGCDYIGVVGVPGNLQLATALKRGAYEIPKFEDYKIVILQQVSGPKWLHEIIRLRRKGVRVFYEVDDYLHGVRKIRSHRAKSAYTKKRLAEFELCMKACDGMIVSTPWLAKAYAKFNANVYVCRNGIQGAYAERFRLPQRDTINIGWAGGEGHLESFRQWVPAIESILATYEKTRFISIGLPVANLFKQPDRCVALPFVSIENFPAALTNFDIGVAPAGRGDFFAAKSDLRFLETGSLGIPLVADPFVYDEIEDGETGFCAEWPDEVESALATLIEDGDKRAEIGWNARDYVMTNRTIEKAVEQWEAVFTGRAAVVA